MDAYENIYNVLLTVHIYIYKLHIVYNVYNIGTHMLSVKSIWGVGGKNGLEGSKDPYNLPKVKYKIIYMEYGFIYIKSMYKGECKE